MSIQYIKIYGERNSGTNFLTELLRNNIVNLTILSGTYNKGSGWKHGFPKHYKENDSKVLYIFLIRDLESWLQSMYKNPYHIKRTSQMNFLYNTLEIREKKQDHPVHMDPREKNNIIKLRYHKISDYLSFYETISNGIFIHLKDLQKNYQSFLSFLKNTYSIQIKDEIIPILSHTKTKEKNIINRIYNELNIEKIPYKNEKMEEFIENLKNKKIYKINNE